MFGYAGPEPFPGGPAGMPPEVAHPASLASMGGYTSDDVKRFCKSSDWKFQWNAYCDRCHGGRYDPSRLTSDQIAVAVSAIGGPPPETPAMAAGPLPGGLGGGCMPGPFQNMMQGMMQQALQASGQGPAARSEQVILTRESNAEKLGFNVGKDMKIQNCSPEGPAGRAGLHKYVGWTLQKINSEPVPDLSTARKFLTLERLVLDLGAPSEEQMKEEELKKFDQELAKFQNPSTRDLMIKSRVKHGQGACEEWRMKWQCYALQYGNGKFDPNQYSSTFLYEAFKVIGVPPKPQPKAKAGAAPVSGPTGLASLAGQMMGGLVQAGQQFGVKFGDDREEEKKPVRGVRERERSKDKDRGGRRDRDRRSRDRRRDGSRDRRDRRDRDRDRDREKKEKKDDKDRRRRRDSADRSDDGKKEKKDKKEKKRSSSQDSKRGKRDMSI